MIVRNKTIHHSFNASAISDCLKNRGSLRLSILRQLGEFHYLRLLMMLREEGNRQLLHWVRNQSLLPKIDMKGYLNVCTGVKLLHFPLKHLLNTTNTNNTGMRFSVTDKFR